MCPAPHAQPPGSPSFPVPDGNALGPRMLGVTSFDSDFDDPQPWVRHYQPGVAARIDYPTTSLVEMFEESCSVGGDAVATQFFDAELTYAQLADQVARLAEGLRSRGVRAGDRVAILLPNCPQHLVAFYAVLRLGAVVVEHNPLFTAPELSVLFADHGARVAIAWDKAVEKLDGITLDVVIAVHLLDAFPPVKRLALALPVPKLRSLRAKLTARPPRGTPWRSVLRGPALDASHPRPGVHDLAVIQYTSGTTGKSKGAMLSHFNLYSNAEQGAAWMRDARDGEETFYAVLPFFHAFGMTLHMTHGVLRRARQVLFLTFDVDQVLDAARTHPPTSYCAVPTIYQRTAERARERGISLKTAKFCISGAMTLPDEVAELWESESGGLLVEGYGMTESAPVALGNPFWPTRRTGTIGIPFPSTWMRVVDVEDPTREVPQGDQGELLLKGPQVFGGYWNNPSETAATLLPGGWLRTGDVVRVDADGFATLVDRVKEIIITGGFNVSPSEVEQALVSHPDVAEVAVVGEPTGRGDERVIAAVVPLAGRSVDPDRLEEWCRGRLAAYKVPRRFVALEELPKSMLGKPLRAQVRAAIIS